MNFYFKTFLKDLKWRTFFKNYDLNNFVEYNKNKLLKSSLFKRHGFNLNFIDANYFEFINKNYCSAWNNFLNNQKIIKKLDISSLNFQWFFPLNLYISYGSLFKIYNFFWNKLYSLRLCDNARMNYLLTLSIKGFQEKIYFFVQNNFLLNNFVYKNFNLSFSQEISIDKITSMYELCSLYSKINFDNNFSYLVQKIKFLNILTPQLGLNVKIKMHTLIESNVIALGKTKIGKNCHIFANAYLQDCNLGDNVVVGQSSIIRKNTVHEGNGIFGPLSDIGSVHFHKGASSYHLNTIVNVEAHKNVQIGAGTIFTNGNHTNKKNLRTHLYDNVRIGSNATLVAPLKIQQNSFIGAGSVITDDVPMNHLGLSRAKQFNLYKSKSIKNETKK